MRRATVALRSDGVLSVPGRRLTLVVGDHREPTCTLALPPSASLAGLAAAGGTVPRISLKKLRRGASLSVQGEGRTAG